MNCRRFQNRMQEYEEGGLSPAWRRAADEHVAGCNCCREALRRHRQLAQFLSEGLGQTAAPHHLSADVRQRILAAAEHRPALPEGRAGERVKGWGWFGWPLAFGIGLVLTALLAPGFFSRLLSGGVSRTQSAQIRPAISIRVSYPVPSYTFRREGDLVVDSITVKTNMVDETLWASGK
ncbi:hypothetical protein SBV1_190065 [Verrucomicrobia bacterium]|nr:hypothetical protein SBV1_190065 [Verrucomicrobiota bacterium]